MKIATPVAAVAAVVLLSACSSAGPAYRVLESPSPVPRPSVSASEGSTPMASAPSADPQQPMDLAGGPTTLTGTVSTAGGCAILDTGAQRWALLGDKAGQLRDGSRVTVRGRPGAVPAGCGVDRALQVVLVS
ncbi:hypothetical protein HC028_25180 [Planosporangium flavigriseum]|nr:hypothetical protein [Planosporangium flavigriseum]NJC67771.1 hypothetical protein [Planosporangium flavigriseum]